MIAARGVGLSLSGKQILQSVDLQLRPGQITALCGPNGAGKSTLLSVLSGEYPGFTGSIEYFERPLETLTAETLARQRVVLEQNPGLAADFTVSELLELGAPLALTQDDLTSIKTQVSEALTLTDLLSQHVANLSGGQQHRAHFARVLVQLRANLGLGHPCFLFLDEPTASLDIAHQISLLDHVRRMAQDGVGALLVLHDLNLASAFSDHVVLLKEGVGLFAGTPDEVLTPDKLGTVYETEILVETTATGQRIIQPVFAPRDDRFAATAEVA